MTTSYKIGTIINSVGLYANVTLTATELEKNECIIEMDEWVEKEWHLPITFAVHYFHEHYKKGIKVKVEKLHTMIFDSSYTTVVYVVVICLCNIFNYHKKLIKLDSSIPCFTFEK